MKKYDNVISLGWFCSVALELERFGLRNSSQPFDWLLTDYESLIDCIKNDFANFLEYENLMQYDTNPAFYYDNYYKIHFYHDFHACIPLSEQLRAVKDRYKRRIERFMSDIRKPSLLIRYIEDQAEADYINSNFENIHCFFKEFNEDNEIIYVANEDIVTNFDVYTVRKDENDTVARKFVDKNKELERFLKSDVFNGKKRKENLEKYYQKQFKKKKDKLISKFFKKHNNEVVKYKHDKIFQ